MIWQPIDTAPKDGTEILVPYPIWDNGNNSETPSEYHVIIVKWNGVGWDKGYWMLHQTPMYWQPVPAPPPLEPHR